MLRSLTCRNFVIFYKEELQQEDARKAAMTGLISKIEAYPDRKIVVDFRIGEVEKRTHGDPGAPRVVIPCTRDIFCAGFNKQFSYLKPLLQTIFLVSV